MLFRTSYSQETLECLKSLVHDERLMKRISGFILKDRWIFFKPEPYDRISEKKNESHHPRQIHPRAEGEKGSGRQIVIFIPVMLYNFPTIV